ncbi:putative sulfate exporter family transporter [Pullulanibacillus sp. KACC 23026]|uniref:YeiH family protein n=1 Tax=Pullulanibacillus sp. KACC 23026 TaxID=3028315 RepID=UPI0023AFCC70|nr:putative sulfate exporter family transporter [Pullulanibacillus sp. KACC 23026]WEG12583.1 putative sulfate exporter family transporter [Pullulanibacillus sp. KACC 23026]
MINKEKTKAVPSSVWRYWIAGVGFTFVIALLGFGLAKLPGIKSVGPLACAIIIAVLYRQFWGYPEKLRAGIQFASKRLLRLAIILFGLKLNMDVVLHQGLGLLVRGAGTIVFAIIVMLLLAKWFKADFDLSLLLGIGTGVCGAAAIAAVSPIVKAKEEDTAIGAGIIALVGTIFSILYTILRTHVSLSASNYGIWSGVSLHEIAQVALAGAPAGPNALAIALLAKLGRVFLLIPVSLILMVWMKRKGKLENEPVKLEYPWFLAGFIIMSLLGTYGFGKVIPVPGSFLNTLSSFTTFILTMAMIGLGLNVSLATLRTKALRPLIAMVITSLLLSLVTYFTLAI